MHSNNTVQHIYSQPTVIKHSSRSKLCHQRSFFSLSRCVCVCGSFTADRRYKRAFNRNEKNKRSRISGIILYFTVYCSCYRSCSLSDLSSRSLLALLLHRLQYTRDSFFLSTSLLLCAAAHIRTVISDKKPEKKQQITDFRRHSVLYCTSCSLLFLSLL